MSSSYCVRWGILATGDIARTFTKDLLINPETRGVHDIQHTVVAVASSSSLISAENFVSNIVTPKQQEPLCAAYGTYSELVQQTNVDIIYVATPHSHHFQHVVLCLDAGKAVLCEKPMTVNARQAKALFEKAKEKGLFLMEAVWTRFFPVSIAVRNHMIDNKIGEVLRVSADMTHILHDEQWDVGNRLIRKDLAGGCLLDIGPYPLLWILQTMWHIVPKERRKGEPRIKGTAMTMDPRTGVDIMTTMLIELQSSPKGEQKAQAVATTGFCVTFDPDGENTAGPTVRLYGTKGELQVIGPIYRPEKYRIILHSGQIIQEKLPVPAGGHGMFWEADEAARCLRDGRLESGVIPWDESILTMELLDEARRQGGLVYPDEIERLTI